MTRPADLEADPRFPSGKWVGFFIDKRMPGRHQMEVLLTFSNGRMSGEGRDRVGKFTFEGSYNTTDGTCVWVKKYLGKHAVRYTGFNEGKGIWGTWELRWGQLTYSGGFHIWPEGMADPTQPRLAEEADIPIEDAAPPVREPELIPG